MDTFSDNLDTILFNFDFILCFESSSVGSNSDFLLNKYFFERFIELSMVLRLLVKFSIIDELKKNFLELF